MQYRKAYRAQKAVAAAQLQFGEQQTIDDEQALQKAASACKAAVATAEASMLLWRQQGGSCPSFADWAAQRAEEEDDDELWSERNSVCKDAAEVVYQAMWEQPQDEQDMLREEAQLLVDQMQKYAQHRFDLEQQNLQKWLQQYPENAARLQWQQQLLQRMQQVLQQPEQLMQWKSIWDFDNKTVMRQVLREWQLPPAPGLARDVEGTPFSLQECCKRMELALNDHLLKLGHLLRTAVGQQCNACVEATRTARAAGRPAAAAPDKYGTCDYCIYHGRYVCWCD